MRVKSVLQRRQKRRTKLKDGTITEDPEKTIVENIKKALKEERIHHFKHWGGGFSKAGIADIVGCRQKKITCPHCEKAVGTFGLYFAIEVKRPGQKPDLRKPLSDHVYKQAMFLQDARKSAGIVAFVDSVDEVIDLLGLSLPKQQKMFK